MDMKGYKRISYGYLAWRCVWILWEITTGYVRILMDIDRISLKDIWMGYLGWRLVEILGDLGKLGYLGWISFVPDVPKRSPESLKISIDIHSYPTISNHLPRYPDISKGANAPMPVGLVDDVACK